MTPEAEWVNQNVSLRHNKMDKFPKTELFLKNSLLKPAVIVLILSLFTSFVLQACNKTKVPDINGTAQSTTPAAFMGTATPTSAISTLSPGPATRIISQSVNNFATASINPVTAIPDVLEGLSIPDEVEVWILLGVDQELPFKGRTDAIHIVFVNERLAKASLLSIPSNLFVFIPGYTMQRINTAYALGGIPLLNETLAYNFGLYPERYVLAHPSDFKWLVDNLGGLEVSVLFPLPDACKGIRSGVRVMKGEEALCYVSYQDDYDEIDRMRRQQQLLRLIFNNLVYNGNLSRLPQLYVSLEDWIESNFSLLELMEYIPLALKLGDPGRISYFMIGWDAVQLWELPDQTQVRVFLPNQTAVKRILQNAVDAVMQPAPLSELVLTLEFQLTQTMPVTSTSTAVTRTPTSRFITGTPTRTRTPTATQPGQIFTPTRTPTAYTYPGETPTQGIPTETPTLYP